MDAGENMVEDKVDGFSLLLCEWKAEKGLCLIYDCTNT